MITASINGVSLKKEKIVYIKGMDILIADVYLDGKLLGSWQENADGGEDYFDFDETILIPAMEAYRDSLPDGYIFKETMGISTFLNEIHNFNELRKTLRKHWKTYSNTKIVVINNGFSNGIISYYENTLEEELNKRIDDMRFQLRTEEDMGFDNLTCVIRKYDSEADFTFQF